MIQWMTRVVCSSWCALAGLTVVALLTGPVAVAADGPLRIGTEGAYPPFNYIDSSGKLTGFDIDIGLALCEQMERECTLVAQDWDGIIPALINGKYDFSIASMYITEERKEKVDFTDPYYAAAMALLAPKDTPLRVFDRSTVTGISVGAQGGTTMADYVAKVFPEATLRNYPTQDEANLDLANGRLQLVVSDMLPAVDWLEKSQDAKCCQIVGMPITDPQYVGTGSGIAVRKGDDKLRLSLNRALEAIRANGTYDLINDRYFPNIDVYTMNPK